MSRSNGELAKRVADLDLEPLKQQLVRHNVLPAGHKLEEAIAAYRQFLELKVTVGDEHATILSPPLLVDTVWHRHILDTHRYAQACSALLGASQRLIHHDADGDIDRVKRAARVNATKLIYKSHFGVPPTGSAWDFGEGRVPVENEAKRARVSTDGPSTSDDVKITLTVLNHDDRSIKFRCLRTTPMSRLFEAAALRFGISLGNSRFIFDGEVLSGHQTAQHLGMEDDDIIDVMSVQYC